MVRFADEKAASIAQFETQEALDSAVCSVTTFAFRLNHAWHIAFWGEPPLTALEKELNFILAGGEPAQIPLEILNTFRQQPDVEPITGGI